MTLEHAIWPRAIAHLDLDEFYAAVEMLDFPSLRGKPVIVGGAPGKRGVVSTANYEARKYGVRSAMASVTAARLCPHASWRPVRMKRYVDFSERVQAIFARYTDLLEPLSLDEAFLDLSGSQRLFGPAFEIVRRIKAEVLAETGLVVSAGLAENKFLAKVASDLKKPDGFVVVPPGPATAAAFLAPLPVKRLWGVGPKTAEELEALGFKRIGQVAVADEGLLARRLGQSTAEHLLKLARGIDARAVVSEERPKSLGRENTYAEDLTARTAMERELLRFAEDIGRRLRARGLRAGVLTLKVRFGDFKTITRATTLSEPTDLAETLHAEAVVLLRTKVDLGGRGVRLLGLSGSRLSAEGEVTLPLFPDERACRQRAAARAADGLQERFGRHILTRARLLEDPQETTGTPSDTPSDD